MSKENVFVYAETYCFDSSIEYILTSFDSPPYDASIQGSFYNKNGTILRAVKLINGFYVVTQPTVYSNDICSLLNPAACTNGLTVSVWAQLLAAPSPQTISDTSAVYILSAGAPQSPGVAILVKYYGVDNVTGLSNIQLVCVLNNGLTTWRADVMLAAARLVSSWHNFALSWGPYIGLLLYLDGQVVGILRVLVPYTYVYMYCSAICGINRNKSTRVDSSIYAAYTTYGVRNSAATASIASGVLVLGQPSYYLTSGAATAPNEINAAFDSVAYWYLSYPVQSAFTRKTLFGDCNVNDAGEFIPGISPSIPTYDQFIASSRTCRCFSLPTCK